MGDHVEGNALGELLVHRLVTHEDGTALGEQLVHAVLAGAGH